MSTVKRYVVVGTQVEIGTWRAGAGVRATQITAVTSAVAALRLRGIGGVGTALVVLSMPSDPRGHLAEALEVLRKRGAVDIAVGGPSEVDPTTGPAQAPQVRLRTGPGAA